MNLRESVLNIYNLMMEDKTSEAEEQITSLVRCPSCAEVIEAADSRNVRIARCGHVYHKAPRDCWDLMLRASSGQQHLTCTSCKKPAQ